MVREEQASWPWFSPDSFSVKNLLTRSQKEIFAKNYWLAPDRKKKAEFVLSLGCPRSVNKVELVNTHNGAARDRATKTFKVLTSMSGAKKDWHQVFTKTLEDSRKQTDPLPLQTFRFTDRAAKFVKFQLISKYGYGGGLQYFAIKGF